MSVNQLFLNSTTLRLTFTLVILCILFDFIKGTDYNLQRSGVPATRLIGARSHAQLRRDAFNPWKGKRNFSPWAGKRDYELEAEDKRAFSPWSGKRSVDFAAEEKRKFTPWAGKRALELEEEKRKFTPWAGKRSGLDDELANKRKFTPWAGKRSEDLSQEEKRKFTPWAGKRSGVGEEEKRKFDPWAGKRSFDEEKRKFGPWSGKRSGSYEHFDGEEKRDSFSPWAGKRAFNSWAGKRAFNAWAGKRSHVEFDPELLSELSGEENEKRAFNPWSGKRDSWDLNDEEINEVLNHIAKRSVHDNNDLESSGDESEDKGLTNDDNEKREEGSVADSSSDNHHFGNDLNKEEYVTSDNAMGRHARSWRGQTGSFNKDFHHDLRGQHSSHSISKRSTTSPQKQFNPWAGKRSLLWLPREDDENPWDDDLNLSSRELYGSVPNQKRAAAAFPPWAGSRILSGSLDNYDKSIFSAVRRGFSPWAGKRVVFQPWAG